MEEARAYLELIHRAIFGHDGRRRFTQDSPILPQVWLAYAENPTTSRDLLLTPHYHHAPGKLVAAIRARLDMLKIPSALQRLAYNDSYAVGRASFEDLCCVLLPLTPWYRSHVLRERAEQDVWTDETILHLEGALRKPPGAEYDQGRVSADLVWLTRVVGLIELARRNQPVVVDPWADGEVSTTSVPGMAVITAIVIAALDLFRRMSPRSEETPLWLVNLNRSGGLAVWNSRQTVKADVAERAFAPDFGGLRWVVLDSGIDARHPAFKRREESSRPTTSESDSGSWASQCRIVETYDFTRLRSLLSPMPGDSRLESITGPLRQVLGQLQEALAQGRAMPWDLLRPLLQVPHDGQYEAPVHEHGTHVAGILAANWPASDQAGLPEPRDLRGMCPTLELYDFRVIDQNEQCDEFSLIAALQFVRWLNAQSDRQIVHGVNLSISLAGDVENYACGRTPVCEECERLVSNGVVAVVAAGNEAYEPPTPFIRRFGAYHDISITDPGNAERVITVGATHRVHPHTYGVSYFSSRGPTADGRMKPDLVAPGEKIVAPVPDCKMKALDGTSMAAPHVSGAAAILMARYRELIGQPDRVKQLLMQTATDLGRERHFQGAGLVDISRALHVL